MSHTEFRRVPGYMKETGRDALMERVDSESAKTIRRLRRTKGANGRQQTVDSKDPSAIDNTNQVARDESGGKPGVPSGAAPLGWKPTFLTPRHSILRD